jgi:hypothetical protein
MDQRRAIELGDDLHCEPELAPGRMQQRVLGHRAHQIAAELEHRADAAIEDALASLDRVHALLFRHVHVEEHLQFVLRHLIRFLGDADRALALHVGVTAHRANAGAGAADIAAQEGEIAHRLHGLHALLMLRQAHAVDEDDGLRVRVDHGGRFQRAARQAGPPLDVLPRGLVDRLGIVLEAMCVFGNELVVDDAAASVCRALLLHREQGLGDADHRCRVAAGLDLVILRGDAC